MRLLAGPLVALVLLLSVGSAAGQDEEPTEIDFERVRGNPLLRQALSANSPFSTMLADTVERQFREKWIDSQVDYFVRQVHQRLSSLRSSVEQAKAQQVSARDRGANGAANDVADWKSALKRVEEQSKGLRNLLANVLIELRARDKFQLKTTKESAAAFFPAETALLFEQFFGAERSIQDYFFKPTHTTSLNELKGANMLDYLRRVEIIAREMRARL
jgi:hypothetical protein